MARYKKRILIAVVIALAAFISIRFAIQANPKEVTLELGVFVGSNWGVVNPNSYIILDNAIAEFESENPGVKVHYETGIRRGDYSEWLSEKLITGRLPDAFLILDEDFDKYASLDALQSLDSFMDRDADFDAQAYYKTAMDAGKRENRQVAMPYEIVPTLMFVNKSLLVDSNISIPSDEWTWDDFYDICAAITMDADGDGTIDQFGAYNYSWSNAVYSNGAQIFDQNGENAYFNDPRVSDAVKFVKRLNDLNQGYAVLRNDFDEGRVAFMPLSYADYKTYKSYPYKIKKYTSFKWDCIVMPAGPSGDNISEVHTLMMGMSSQSRHKELAWELIKKFTYNESVQRDVFRYSSGASVLKNVTSSQELAKIIQAEMGDEEIVITNWLLSNVIERGAIVPKFQYYEEAFTIADIEINKMFAEGKSVDSTLKILQHRMADFK